MSSNDPIDHAALEHATAFANALNLWWGDLAFLLRNFASDIAIAEHWLPVVIVGPTPTRPAVLLAREAVRALAPPPSWRAVSRGDMPTGKVALSHPKAENRNGTARPP